jgi:hypothetical protein
MSDTPRIQVKVYREPLTEASEPLATLLLYAEEIPRSGDALTIWTTPTSTSVTGIVYRVYRSYTDGIPSAVTIGVDVL